MVFILFGEGKEVERVYRLQRGQQGSQEKEKNNVKNQCFLKICHFA